MLEGHLLSDRYRIKRTIGGGGMANVYLAEDIILNRDVAIKVLRLEYANDDEFIARFDREAKAATSLAHPNIVNIFDVGEEDHILYMVMEYVDGLTLKEYIQRFGPIEVEEALNIMKQVTSAIAHAHANDLVHRDIKPQNILIDKYGNVKVTDFGIAVALSATSLTQTNSILGSVHYLSPEQARGGMATKKSDIYSLGIVLFELLTGRLPFSGQTPVSIALKHLQTDTPSVRSMQPNIPQSVENIVLKATTKDPFHRYETVYELEEALETALHPSKLNEPVYTPPVEAGEETKAIPIITDNHLQQTNENTIVHSKNEKTKTFTHETPETDEPKKKSKKKKWLIISSVFLSLLVAAILALFVLPKLLQPKEVDVPDVVGEEYEDAIYELESLKLDVKQEMIHSPDVEENLVVKTDPKAGRSVKEGSTVTIFVSQGEEPIPFNDYVGRDFSQVKRILIDRGFDEENITVYEKNSDKQVGEIIAQIQPAPDSKVIPSEEQVIFEVSSGPKLVSLNNLKGYSESEAKKYLEDRKLKMNKLEENSDSVPEGEVIRQSPEANTELEEGATVDVYISIGEEEIPPTPHTVSFTVEYELEEEQVDGENNEDNNQQSEPQPQTVLIYIGDMNHNITDVFQEDTITEDTEYTITLTIEHGKEGEYKVVSNDQVVRHKTISEEGE